MRELRKAMNGSFAASLFILPTLFPLSMTQQLSLNRKEFTAEDLEAQEEQDFIELLSQIDMIHERLQHGLVHEPLTPETEQ
jgi:hypothetical protein